MSRAKSKKTIKVTLEVEYPYTSYAVLTFGGACDKGLVVTSKPMKLNPGAVIHVGENGGIEQMTANEAKRRRSTKSGDEES